MVIVQSYHENRSNVEDIKTSNLKPYKGNTPNPYITAYFKIDSGGPLRFIVGNGKKYEYKNKMYLNKPLEQNSSYIVFLRYFENEVNSQNKINGLVRFSYKFWTKIKFTYKLFCFLKNSYYSTEWSKEVYTLAKPSGNFLCILVLCIEVKNVFWC